MYDSWILTATTTEARNRNRIIYCQLGTEKTKGYRKMRQNEGRLPDFLDPTVRPDHSYSALCFNRPGDLSWNYSVYDILSWKPEQTKTSA